MPRVVQDVQPVQGASPFSDRCGEVRCSPYNSILPSPAAGSRVHAVCFRYVHIVHIVYRDDFRHRTWHYTESRSGHETSIASLATGYATAPAARSSAMRSVG